jgi:hypothetical protein
MPPSSMGAARFATQRLMTQTATVYTPGSGGKFTAVARRDLPCRLVQPRSTGATAAGRAELMADRDLWWDPDVVLPEQCQILVDGVRWQPVAGTFASLGDGVVVVARRAMVIRVQTTSF